MVYPQEYEPLNPGSRDVLDDSDHAIPFVVALVRQGSSDHVQPNFPTPGQIRSMFNTNKVNECPEYASSPSTMTDPVEWRPNTQLDMIEERLLRIQQWAENSFQRQSYEGNNVLITDLSRSNESSTINMVHGGELDFNVEQTVYDLSESIRVNLYSDELDARSEVGHIPSNETLKSDGQGSNQREYDVEEYVEQMNSNDIMNNSSSNLLRENFLNDGDEFKSYEGINRDTYGRIKQLEKIFKLNINEADNNFIKELKTMLTQKIRDFMRQKDYHDLCPLNEVIEELADVLNEAINDNDSVICDNVHDLCLKLKDIITLKEEIMGNAFKEYPNDEKGEFQAERETDNITPEESSYSGSSTKENDHYDVNISAQQSEEQFEKDCFNERMNLVNTEFLSEIESNEQFENKDIDSFESLITFSRIPVANQSKLKSSINNLSSLKLTQNKNQKPQCMTRIPLYQPASRNESLEKRQSENETDNKERLKSSINKQLHAARGSCKLKQVKDISQQKEELVRKATLLGLIDEENNISRVPHLTERAQLALLERQIQGRLKSRQLAKDRKKTGLPERINNKQSSGYSTSIKISNTESQKSKPSLSPVNSSSSNIEKNESSHRNEIKKQKKSNNTSVVRTNSKIGTKVAKKIKNTNEQSSTQADEINPGDDKLNLQNKESAEINHLLETFSKENKNISAIENTNQFEIRNESEQATSKDIPLLTSFIAPKEKLNNWDADNITPSHSVERLSNHSKKSRKLLILLAAISIIIAIFSIAFYHYQPQLCEGYFKVFCRWIEIIRQTNWKEAIKKHVNRFKTAI